jgi:hypothetical protein
MTIVYEKLEIPSNYKCSRCKAHGIKLWRQYQTGTPELLCHRCADPALVVDLNGRVDSKLGRCDQIDDKVGKTGSLVPAVPTVECDTYWGYTSVPVAGCAWWRALPNQPGEPAQPFYAAPEDLAAEQLLLEERRCYERKPDSYKRDTVYCVEATYYEQHMLWCQHASEASLITGITENRRLLMGAQFVEDLFDKKSFCEAERRQRIALPKHLQDRRRVNWAQLNPGSMPTIATDNKRPICVSCFWVRIDGHVVMFYEPTSRLVDWQKVDAWLAKEYPEVPKCDAQNFHNCLIAIRDRNKAAKAS